MKTYISRDKQDKSLNSGERQVQIDPDLIDYWHKWRYEQALEFINQGETVVDLGCGIGYGSFILGQRGLVVGVDDSAESIEFAEKHYARHSVTYVNADVFDVREQFDVTVAFEVLEHVESPEAFFALIKKITKKRVILSTPHISVDLEHSLFHYRHFTEEEIADYLDKIGFKVLSIDVLQFTKGEAVFVRGERC